MAISFAALLLIFAVSKAAGTGSAVPNFDPNCDDKWKSISAGHTMCIVGDEGTEMTVDPSTVLALHNQKRGTVNPPATDMRKVYWDAEAATVAAKWARQCDKYGSHDENDARKLPSYKYMSVGQNMAMSSSGQDWQGVVDRWYNEVNQFKYGIGASPSGSTIGHFAQLVSKDVYRIGCGMASCADGYYYICNYITGQYSKTNPYTNGTRCASCPGKCSDGLCDCGDTACMYQSAPADGCGCTCQPHMSGSDCSTVTCESESFCSQITESYCSYLRTGTTKYFRYMCPQKCGLC